MFPITTLLQVSGVERAIKLAHHNIPKPPLQPMVETPSISLLIKFLFYPSETEAESIPSN
jgi:hypothetical protein